MLILKFSAIDDWLPVIFGLQFRCPIYGIFLKQQSVSGKFFDFSCKNAIKMPFGVKKQLQKMVGFRFLPYICGVLLRNF